MKQFLKIAFLTTLFSGNIALSMTRAPAGDGRLIAAAKNGDIAYVKDLVEKKHANINFHSEQTALSLM